MKNLALEDIQFNDDHSGINVKGNNAPLIVNSAGLSTAQNKPQMYILKPFVEEEQTQEEVETTREQNTPVREFNPLDRPANQRSLFIKVSSRLIRIEFDDILFIEAKGDYTLFKTEKKGYIVNSTIKNVEEKLDSGQFVKIHRSYIVNVDKVVDIEENNLFCK